MNIETLDIAELSPYGKNAKKHPKEQVERIAASIRDFGWQQPLVIDKDNVLVIGHGRYAAAKMLGLREVPCVRANQLSEEQIKALRLADNKTAESEWDDDLLNFELDDIGLDMSWFGFESKEERHKYDKEGIEYNRPDRDSADWIHPQLKGNPFENQERKQFRCDTFYGMPQMKATQTVGDKFLRFCDWRSVSDTSDYIARFYYADNKFMSIWREPDKHIDKLSRFKAVVSPDFSLYTDFPRALQILSCYRRQWCGAFWQQEYGLDVIPDVVWGDRESYAYCFDGLPEGGTVAVSTVGVRLNDDWNGKNDNLFLDGYNEMMERLHPTTVLVYGNLIDGLTGNLIRIPSFYEQRRSALPSARKKE